MMRLLAALRALIAIWCLIGIDPAWAENCLLTLCGGVGFSGATVYLGFSAGQYKGLSLGQITFSRASPWWAVCNGTLYTFGNNTAPITPCGYDGGWETRTNSNPNSTFVGGSPGSPGTLPTGWSSYVSTTGLSQSSLAFPSVNGMTQMSVTFTGTASATNTITLIISAGNGTATYGQTWTQSAYISLAVNSGATPQGYLEFDEINSGGSYLAASTSASSLNTTLKLQTLNRTFTASTVDHARTLYGVTVTNGQTYNFTLNIALPGIELNPNLPASVASATVAGGGSLYVGASGTMTYSGTGCTTNPVLNVTTSAGAISAVTSVATAGVCPNGLPAAGATTWTPGGGLSVGTGASFNLVPTDNSASAFATPPILTSGTAVTRAATNATGPLPSCSNPSIYVAGTPAAPTTYPVAQFAAQLDDGGTTNLIKLVRAASTGQPVVGTKTQTVTVSGGPWAQSTPAKLTESIGGGNVNGRFNGGTASTAAATSPPALNRLQIGSQGGVNNFNGVITTLAVACNGASLLNN